MEIRELNDLTLRELRFVSDHYSKSITILRLREVVKELADQFNISDADALEAWKLGTHDCLDLYVRKNKILLNKNA